MICPNCKYENKEDEIFCVNCGLKLELSEEINDSVGDVYQEDKENNQEDVEKLRMFWEEKEHQLKKQSEKIQEELRNQIAYMQQTGEKKKRKWKIYGILVSFVAGVFIIMSMHLNDKYKDAREQYWDARTERNEVEKENESLKIEKQERDEVLPDIMVEVVNVYNSDKKLNVIGEKKTGITGLSNEDIKYLSFDYKVYKFSSEIPETIDLGINILIPSGKRAGNSGSYTMTKEVSTLDNTKIYSVGYGSNQSGYYGQGTYSIVFYYENKIVGCKTIILD